MFEIIENIWQWFSDVATPFITFFRSFIHGLQALVNMFPRIWRIVTAAIGYVPSLFVVFITITLSISIVYIIVGRNTGG